MHRLVCLPRYSSGGDLLRQTNEAIVTAAVTATVTLSGPKSTSRRYPTAVGPIRTTHTRSITGSGDDSDPTRNTNNT